MREGVASRLPPRFWLASEHGLVSRVVDFLLPPACAACGGPVSLTPSRGAGGFERAHRSRVCPGCALRLRALPHPRCGRCDAPRGTGLRPDRECAECRDWPPVLVSARSVAILEFPADRLVHGLKYGGWPSLAVDLGGKMAGLLDPPRGDLPAPLLVPVPTTPGRLRARGYNQARLLAEEVARRVGGTLLDVLVRADRGGSQVALQRDERRANVQGAFSVRREAAAPIRGREVFLVDDVLTTGATASAAALALAEGGATGVRLLTCARSLPAAS